MKRTLTGRALRCCTVSLALLSAVPSAGARAADCWLLDGHGLEQARRQGLCLDSFARDAGELAAAPGAESPPPLQGGGSASWSAPGRAVRQAADAPPPRPESAPAQRRPPPRTDPATAALAGLKGDLDYFVYDVRRDFAAFGRMLRNAGDRQAGPDHDLHGR